MNPITALFNGRSRRVRDLYPLFRIADYLGGDRLILTEFVFGALSRIDVQYQHMRPHETRTQKHEQRVAHDEPPDNHEPVVACFADSVGHLNGINNALRSWSFQASAEGQRLQILSCAPRRIIEDSVCFDPVGLLRFLAYHDLEVYVPELDSVLSWMEGKHFNVVHVLTPGPMGLAGLVAAKRRGLPVCGTFHTNFPAYADCYSDDRHVTKLAWKYMRWFYDQADCVAVPSSATLSELVEMGFEKQKLTIVGRGVDSRLFSPCRRDTGFLHNHITRHRWNLLYAGRIAKEKDLSCLVDAFRLLTRTRSDVALIVVGDGPYRSELTKALNGTPAVIYGAAVGEQLARIYASCDVFVFPSQTETFGNVVLEAQASGLPVIVSAAGGARETVRHGLTGTVLPAMDAESLCLAVESLLDEPDRLKTMGRNARKHACRYTHERAFRAFWGLHETCLSQTVQSNAKGLDRTLACTGLFTRPGRKSHLTSADSLKTTGGGKAIDALAESDSLWYISNMEGN